MRLKPDDPRLRLAMDHGPLRAWLLPPAEQAGMELLGLHVRRLRTLAGLSQRALAAAVGVNQSTICRLERGQLRHFRFTTLARVLGVLEDPRLALAIRRNRWTD